jgi:fructose-1,6-bisphosphatase II / sedoheptulose-1,7-bisphosphatase
MAEPLEPNSADKKLDRSLIIEIIRATEKAAIAAARLRGKLDDIAADKSAIEAMHDELNMVHIDGKIVIGEAKGSTVPKLFVGEAIGTKQGPKCDIALDPLEGTTICAKDLQNAMSVIAIARPGSLLNAPDVYMKKIAIGPGFNEGIISLEKTPAENLTSLAQAKGVDIADLNVCILDRQRHGKLIGEVNKAGASIRLISDGDLAGVINTTNSYETGIDIYMGSGGAREGVLAACALCCMGGQMQGRLILDGKEKQRQAAAMGIDNPHRIYDLSDMAHGDIMFAATGVTEGNLLSGVRFEPNQIFTNSLVMRSTSKTIREISTRHPLNNNAN